MMGRLITPPEPLDLPAESPLIFLAGPVQGAPDWQTDFANRLMRKLPHAFVASPRRTRENQQRFNAHEQVTWEHSALERARSLGVVAFWWAGQNLEDETYPTGRAYAQTTRIEFGKATGWKQFQPELPVIVGYDPTYGQNGGGSEGYVRKEAGFSNIPVYDSDIDFLEAILDSVKRVRSSSLDPR